MKVKLIVIFFSFVLLFGKNYDQAKKKDFINITKGAVARYVIVKKPFNPGIFTDQFSKKGHVRNDTKRVIMVFGESAGRMVKKYLDAKPANYLTFHNSLFIANVSGIPSLIFRYIVLPDFKKSGYSIYLIKNENIAKRFENSKYASYVMIINLDHCIVKNVIFLMTPAELEKVLN